MGGDMNRASEAVRSDSKRPGQGKAADEAEKAGLSKFGKQEALKPRLKVAIKVREAN